MPNENVVCSLRHTKHCKRGFERVDKRHLKIGSRQESHDSRKGATTIQIRKIGLNGIWENKEKSREEVDDLEDMTRGGNGA